MSAARDCRFTASDPNCYPSFAFTFMYSAFDQTCSCGKHFGNVSAFKNHQNSCKKNKKLLLSALTRAKDVLAFRKRKAGSVDAGLPTEANVHVSESVLEDQETEVRVHSASYSPLD